MATSSMTTFMHQLRRSVLVPDGAGLTDGQLLTLFIERRDEGAFEALVRRHGPMVMGVCRRVLRNQHDAEDAFQASFLVLVRKAASVLPREMVANWLHGVAYMTAHRAKVAIARRRVKEKQVMEMHEPKAVEQDRWLDLLDQELKRLPEKYRIVLLLCDLEDKTRNEVARQLGCPEGTVASRLARARRMLAKQLTRHGPGGALAAMLSQNAASACVPNSLVSSTVKAASLLAVGQAAGVVSVKVAALTEGVLKTMLLTKLKIVTAVLLVASVVAFGAVVRLLPVLSATEQPDKPGAHQAAQPHTEAKPVIVREDAMLTQLAWSSDGKALATVGITYDTVQDNLTPTSHIKLWDARSGKLKRVLGVEKGTLITAIAFSRDGRTAALAIAKGDVGPPLKLQPVKEWSSEVRLVDTETWKFRRKVDEDRFVKAIAFSPDSQRLAFGGGDSPLVHNGCFVGIWDVQKEKPIAETKECKLDGDQADCLAFSFDGKLLAAGDRNGKIWLLNGLTGESNAVLNAYPRLVSKIAFSPDGKTLASGSLAEKTIKLWDVPARKLRRTLEGNNGSVHALAFSPDGKLLATAGAVIENGKWNRELILWDGNTGEVKQFLRDPNMPVSLLAFSPDSKSLAIGGGDLIGQRGRTAGELRLLKLEAEFSNPKNEARNAAAKLKESPSRAEQLKAIQTDYQNELAEVGKAISTGKVLATKDGTYVELAELRERFAKRTRELIDAQPKDEVALDAILFSIQQLVADQNDPRLHRLILAHHSASAKLSPILDRGYTSDEFLRTVAEKSPHAKIRGQARLVQAKRLAHADHAQEAEAICQRIISEKELTALHRDAEDLLFEIRHLTVGRVVPEVEGVDLDDKPMKLSEYRGKAVLLVFWGTWCGPCMAMIPHERELAKRFL